MATTSVKRGDTPDILRNLTINGQPVALSSTTHQVLWSAWNSADTSSLLWFERDVSDYNYSNWTPAIGQVVLPLWDGRTDIGTAASATVADNSVDGKINVTAAAAGDPEVIYQEIWMQKAGAAAGDSYYFVAQFADGTHAVSPYVVNVADASLVQANWGEDRSKTAGEALALPTPVTPVAALAGAGAGNCTNGSHRIAIINKRASDTDTILTASFEVILVDMTTGTATTWPQSGFETLAITEDIR